MNRVILMGRLTRDPEVRYTQESVPWLLQEIHPLAVDRRGRQNQDGNEQTADFINIVAFDRAGEFARKVFPSGDARTGVRTYPDWQLHQQRRSACLYHRHHRR